MPDVVATMTGAIQAPVHDGSGLSPPPLPALSAKDRHEALGREARPDPGRPVPSGRTSSSPMPRTPTWGPSLTWSRARKREPDGSWTRYRTRAEFLDQIRAIVRAGLLDIMLMSASNTELLIHEGLFKNSPVTPAIRANDTSDIWRMRGAALHDLLRARSARPRSPGRCTAPRHPVPAAPAPISASTRSPSTTTSTPICLRSKPSPISAPTLPRSASAISSGVQPERRFPASLPDVLPAYVNDAIPALPRLRHRADRPQFLKIVYNGPKALEELTSFDPAGDRGVLGGGGRHHPRLPASCFAGRTLRRTRRLVGREISLAETPLAIVATRRAPVAGAGRRRRPCKAYHGELQKQRIKPQRPLEDDMAITEAVLQQR